MIVATTPDQRSFSLQQMETRRKIHNQMQCGGNIVGIPVPSQLLYLWLREHQGRGVERLLEPEDQKVF